MAKPIDDLEAVRVLVDALEGFQASEQERIIRWAREKLGLDIVPTAGQPTQDASVPAVANLPAGPGKAPIDIRSFVKSKNPQADTHFAATVAYYYRFEAPQAQRKPEINSADLQEACRLANRPRLNDPGSTLRNALKLGFLDKGGGSGNYAISTVGENLVAMTLPLEGKKPATRTQSRKATSKQVRPSKSGKKRG